MVGIMSVSFCQISVLESCCYTFLLKSEIYSWISRTLGEAPHWGPSIAYHSLIQVVMFSLFYYLISSHGFEGQPNVPPPNTPIWQKDCLELRYLRFNRSGRKPSQISLYLTKSRNSWEIRTTIYPLSQGSFMATKKRESWHQDGPTQIIFAHSVTKPASLCPLHSKPECWVAKAYSEEKFYSQGGQERNWENKSQIYLSEHQGFQVFMG